MPRYKSFTIDIEHCTGVQDIRYWVNMENPTPEDLIKILKNEHIMSIGTADHPEFTKLRSELEKLCYIRVERGWWNGDRVIKPFILNEVLFKKHATFFCGSAMKNVLQNFHV